MVAGVCAELGVPHAILIADWSEAPTTAIQERARRMRYRLLSRWAGQRSLDAVATGHHLDDQAETLIMRLARGAGVRGLAGMRPVSRTADGVALIRPLLGWRRDELEQLSAAAGVQAVDDPSNKDESFERVRVRKALGTADWLDPEALARSAGNLADADEAVRWAAGREWLLLVEADGDALVYHAGDAPREIQRRIARRAVLSLASEGGGADLRGRELDEVLSALAAGETRTLRGVLCAGGRAWRFSRAPARDRSGP